MNRTQVSRGRSALRSLLAGFAAVAALGGLSLPTAPPPDLRLIANTLLVMGGNENSTGLTPRMQQELGGDPWYPGPNPDPTAPVGVFGEGYIDTENNPDSPYAGWDFTLVNWPAQILLPIFGWKTYGESQRAGMAAMEAAITDVMPTLASDERVVAFGYSSSANVMVRVMRALQEQGSPDSDRLSFTLVGNPNRPNGGFLQRFAGLYIPVLNVDFDGTTPLDTPYPTVDISWEYEGASDFPTYPLNLLATLNTMIGGSNLHGNYFNADINGERAFPDTTVGNITYITLKPPHLPLLMPLYNLGFPTPLLELIEPALTVMVDWGYDRTVGPGTPTTAGLLPRIDPLTAANDLLEAINEGVRNAVDSLTPESPTPASVRPGLPSPVAMTRAERRAVSAAQAATTSSGTPSSRIALPGQATKALPATAVTGRMGPGSADRDADRHVRDGRANRQGR